MPRELRYSYRQYCKKCEDFTLHQRVHCDETTHPLWSSLKFDEGQEFISICKVCDTHYTSVTIGEIDPNKVLQQRKRYKEQKSAEFNTIFGILSLAGSSSFFDGVSGPEHRIVESDAGLEAERERKRIKDAETKALQTAELLKHKHLGRNDKCLCASGKKYKNCCLTKHNSYG